MSISLLQNRPQPPDVTTLSTGQWTTGEQPVWSPPNPEVLAEELRHRWPQVWIIWVPVTSRYLAAVDGHDELLHAETAQHLQILLESLPTASTRSTVPADQVRTASEWPPAAVTAEPAPPTVPVTVQRCRHGRRRPRLMERLSRKLRLIR